MSKKPLTHALFGVLLMMLLCGMTNTPQAPVFSAETRASALTYDESTLYAPGVRRFEANVRPSWELDVWEMRDARFSYPILHQVVLGIPALIAGTEAVWRAAHMLLPACAWLLIFLWVHEARQSAALASAAAWAAIILSGAPRNALLLGADAFTQPLEFTRTPHPALSTLLLLLALTGLLRVLTQERTRWLWITGPLFGILFYAYYFHFVAAWSLLGTVFLMLLLRREARLWKVLVIIVSGLAVAAPYLLWTVQSMRSGISQHLMARIGEFTRAPSWAAVAGLVLAGCAFFRVSSRREKCPHAWLLCGLIAGAFVVANLHVVTGYDAQHEHAWNRLIQPFGVILVACCVPWRGVWLNALPVFMIALAFVRQGKVSQHLRTLDGGSKALWAELAKYDSGELVIGVLDQNVRGLLPAKTHHWSFVPIGFRTLASNEEILTRFAIVARLGGLSQEQARSLLMSKHAEGPRSYAYGLLDDYVIQPADLARFDDIWPQTTVIGPRRLDVLLLSVEQQPAETAETTFSLMFEAPGWKGWRVMRRKTFQ